VIHYFDFQGRGEPIRWLLSYLGVDFVDNRISQEDWPNLKEHYEFHQVPCLEIDGMKLVQSRAIMRYVAQKHNMHPHDAYQMYLVESLIDLKEDIMKTFFKHVILDKNRAAWENYIKESMPGILRMFEARLNDQKYFLGDSPTIADFEIAEYFYDRWLHSEDSELKLPILRENAPKLLEYSERFVENLPEVKAYVQRRP